MIRPSERLNRTMGRNDARNQARKRATRVTTLMVSRVASPLGNLYWSLWVAMDSGARRPRLRELCSLSSLKLDCAMPDVSVSPARKLASTLTPSATFRFFSVVTE